MVKLVEIVGKAYDEVICEGGNDGHLSHLFERGDMSFADLRSVFQKLFTGKLSVTEKLDGMNLNVTVVDGEVMASRNKSTLKNPMPLADVEAKFTGRGEVQKAFVNTVRDLQKALSSLSQEDLSRYFANGRKFMSVEIISPGTRNVVDYGSRCMVVFHGINEFDETGKRVGQDKSAAEELYRKLAERDALKQKTFEISGPVKLKLKSMRSSQAILEDVLAKLSKLVDGLGWKATVADYARERFIRYVVNAAAEAGFDLDRKSQLAVELADRMSDVSGRRPTKSDIATYAKREGIDVKSEQYKGFVKLLDDTADTANQEVISPLEDLVVYAGTQLMQQLRGYVSLDPSATAKKTSEELDAAIAELRNGSAELTPDKARRLKKNLAKLEKYGNKANPAEGLVFMWKGKPVKLTGNFAQINQILGILKY